MGTGLVNWAEGRTGGEAFIPLGDYSNIDRSWSILFEAARQLSKLKPLPGDIFGRGLHPNPAIRPFSGTTFASGGILRSKVPMARMAAGGLTGGASAGPEYLHQSHDVHIGEMTVVASDPMELMRRLDTIRKREALTV